jgi:hypothetical protein
VQPADLRPVLHSDHPPHRRGVAQISTAARGSVFDRRRHRWREVGRTLCTKTPR